MDNRNACFVKEPDFVTREIAGETIIVPIRNNVGDLNAIYTLNEVGTAIWQQIDGRTTVREIAEALCSAYEVDASRAEQDTLDYLAELQKADLVRLSDDAEKKPAERAREDSSDGSLRQSSLLEASY
jgi:aminoglycoside phosphotransferase (APT) family kinase protein